MLTAVHSWTEAPAGLAGADSHGLLREGTWGLGPAQARRRLFSPCYLPAAPSSSSCFRGVGSSRNALPRMNTTFKVLMNRIPCADTRLATARKLQPGADHAAHCGPRGWHQLSRPLGVPGRGAVTGRSEPWAVGPAACHTHGPWVVPTAARCSASAVRAGHRQLSHRRAQPAPAGDGRGPRRVAQSSPSSHSVCSQLTCFL